MNILDIDAHAIISETRYKEIREGALLRISNRKKNLKEGKSFSSVNDFSVFLEELDAS